jgi:hypothetical protein
MWIRGGRGFCALDTLPFVERHENLSRDYDWLALAAVLIGLWGYLMLPRHRDGDRREPQPSPDSSPSRPRFRSNLIFVPVAIIALALIAQHLRLAMSFGDVVGYSPKLVEHIYLAVLCVIVFAVLLVLKWIRNP